MAEQSKILVVDDEAVIRELMHEFLRDEGYDVKSVPCGSAALQLLEESDEYVILFTDIMMPEMDGITLIREARKIRPATIPIVMTGFATLETARAAVREGAYDYVLKPFSLSEIKLAVTNAQERYRLTSENTRLRDVSELLADSEQVAQYRDERKLLDFVLNIALRRLGAKRGSIMLACNDGRQLEVAASVGLPDEAAHGSVEIGKGISGWVAEHGRPLLVEDIKQNPDMSSLGRHLKDASFISIPLQKKVPIDDLPQYRLNVDEPQILAVLNVCQKEDGRHFSESDLKKLSILANHASIAIQNVRLVRDVEQAHLSTLTSMALLLEAKDQYTHGHSERVRDLSLLTAKKLGLSQEDIKVLELGAGLHDIGKIGVNDSVLNKNGRLTEEEWELVRTHPLVGYDVLSPVKFLSKGHLALVRNHHERLDGNGYPDGLSGDQLPETVRIITVVDAYDAMSSSRAYRKGMPTPIIIEELKRSSGTQFDKRIAKLFIEMLSSGDVERFF